MDKNKRLVKMIKWQDKDIRRKERKSRREKKRRDGKYLV